MKLGNKKEFLTAGILFIIIMVFIIMGTSIVKEEDVLIEQNPENLS